MIKFPRPIFEFLANGIRGGASGEYNRGGGIPASASAAFTYYSAILADNPRGYWRFEETSGSTAFDTASSTDGTITGVTLNASTIVANSNRGFDFSTGRINLGTGLAVVSAVTLEAWIKPDGNYTGYNNIISKRPANTSNTQYQMFLDITTGYLSWYDGNVLTYSSTVIPASTWCHTVFTAVSSGELYMYVNGVNVYFSTQTAITGDAAAPVAIGALYDGTIPFKGDLDEVAIYDYALTHQKINSHYAHGLGYASSSYPYNVVKDRPIAYWRLQETTGSTAVSNVNININGVYVNGVNKGQAGLITDSTYAADFDGVNDYVSCGDVIGQNTNLTIECIFSVSSTPGSGTYDAIVSKWGETAANDEFLLSIDSSAIVNFGFHTTGSDTYLTTSYNNIDTQASVGVDTPHHIAVVRSSTRVDIYLDKVLVYTSTGVIDSNPFKNTSSPIRIGAQVAGTGRYLDGKISDVAIYATALTSAVVSSHFAATGL